MDTNLDPADGMLNRAALAQEVLLSRMKLLSEDFYAAGWISGLEFDVWEMAQVHPHKLWAHEVTDDMSKSFRDLATIANGWWVSSHTVRLKEKGPVFISIAEWHQILAKRVAAKTK